MQERFRRYWGVSENNVREVGRLAKVLGADVVVVVGLNVLPYLGAVQNATRVWYAGDEWLWHHWSQVRTLQPGTWSEMKAGLIKGLYERKYAPLLDRSWVVSAADRKALHWVAGCRNVDVLPNGVDADYFRPESQTAISRSCVFWGRLDFGPNIQALEWFCNRIWPGVRRRHNDASFSIYGFQPTERIQALVRSTPGVQLHPDLPDIRDAIRQHQVVILPFVSGGGIKNKLLEAAALGMPIVCTPRTTKGLSAANAVVCPSTRRQWNRTLAELWGAPERRNALGAAAREWVLKDHTWSAVARKAVAALSPAEGVKEVP
jgi:glycosyltransferase involved in cell wall biosynthesis